MKKFIKKIFSTCLFLTTVTACFALNHNPTLSIITDKTPGLIVSHGVTKLIEALSSKNINIEKVRFVKEAKGKWIIVAGLSTGNDEAAKLLKSSSHAIRQTPEALGIYKSASGTTPLWIVSGSDDNGLMYALLDLADHINWSKDKNAPLSEVKETTEQPAVAERAISMYTMNRAYWESRMYDEAYWKRYLDMLARDRFNSLVVIFGYENGGFLAPCYPYFFDVDGYPDVKLIGITTEQQRHNLESFNRIIDLAHERGINFTVGIWDHIYRGGVQGGGIPGTKDSPDKPVPGLVWGLNADNLTAYSKKALAKFVNQVPHLDGIQFRMHDESGLKNAEQDAFWLDVFKSMKETKPDLKLDLRAKELKESIIQSAIDVGVKFTISTKYWMEQMGLPYHPTQINPEKSPRRHSYSDLLRYPKKYVMHWQLWNGGTSRILLWGDPEYARRFAESTHLYDGDGFEVNEPLATKMEAQPHDAKPFELLNKKYQYYEYEFERYWHFYQVFGRMAYNPKTSSVVWDKDFANHFGAKAGMLLETALHKASWILPRIIASSYPYSSFPTTRGWAEKQRLGDLPTFAKAEGSDIRQFANFDEEAQLLLEKGETAKILPSTTSRWFAKTSADLNSLVTQAEKATGTNPGKEFISTVTDLKILLNLALYHSRRISAAVSYRLFERSQDVSALDEAIRYEKSAVEAWRKIVASASDVYTSDLMMGVRVADLCGHWKDELPLLETGIQTLEEKRSTFTPVGKVTVAPKFSSIKPTDFDKLFVISDKPLTSTPAKRPININITISSTAGIKWVRLRYRSVNQEEAYKTLPMTATGAKNVYQVTVPASEVNPKFDFMYFVEIMDKNSHGKIYPDVNKGDPYRIVKLVR
jgi:hypothetical protein